MISTKMAEALNDQINAEMQSSYLYLSMATWFDAQGWEGMTKWMVGQAKEEDSHAHKIVRYISEQQSRVLLKAIEQPKTEWSSPLEAFQDALKHEQYITSRINNLFKLAKEDEDFATEGFLTWYIKEQVEEEATAAKIVLDLERIGSSMQGMYMLDHSLGARQ
ncbi:MAG: ferritin [Firmicutes bacterium]|nr:ferritin [Bacillota bacterium]